LLYGIEACPVNTTDLRSLEFTVKRIMIKIFRTYDNDIIGRCMTYFGFPVVRAVVERRQKNFQINLRQQENPICSLINSRAQKCSVHV